MRDSTKVLIGFGCIWGLFELGASLLGSFNFGSNDTAPERFAIFTSGLGILPCCLLAIWHQRVAAWLLISIAAVCGYGYAFQILWSHEEPHGTSLGTLAWALCLTCIPGLIGFLLLRVGRIRNRARPSI